MEIVVYTSVFTVKTDCVAVTAAAGVEHRVTVGVGTEAR